MDTNSPNENQINQQFNQQFGSSQGAQQSNLPNAIGALVLGIVSVFFGLIWCYFFGTLISLICGIVALILAKGGNKLAEANPNLYTQSSIKNNRAGKILGIIGVCLSGIWFIILIIILAFFGAAASSFGHF